MVRSDVSTVPVVVVREEDRLRFFLGENRGQAINGWLPLLRMACPCFEMDAFESMGARRSQAEPDIVAASLEVLPTRLLARAAAPLRHGHIDDVPCEFAQQTQSQSANDHLIVRMRGEDEGARGIRVWLGPGW